MIRYTFTYRAEELYNLSKSNIPNKMIKEFVYPPKKGDLIGTKDGILAFKVIQILHGWNNEYTKEGEPCIYIKLDLQ